MEISEVIHTKNFSSERAGWSHWAQPPHFIDVETEAPNMTRPRDSIVLQIP